MNYAEDFPILQTCTYLNTANSGLLSKPLALWRSQHDEAFMQGGSMFRAENLRVMEDLRSNLAATFSVNQENTFLSPNFSSGFNAILDGLGQQHRVLLLGEDYPSVSYPVSSRGYPFLEVKIDENLEENILQAIDRFRPSIFAFSMVQYISGLRMQSDFILKLKATYPELQLIADGTQFLGTGPFDFNASGLDILIGSGYKWLLGGYGNGYIFLSDNAKEQLFENRKNMSLPTAPFLHGRAYTSLALEPGHLDSLNFGSLNVSISYLNKIGLDKIASQNMDLTNQARLALENKGFLPAWMLQRKEQSTIISMALNDSQIDKLKNANISCSPRGTGTRISFHYYNTKHDLEHLLDTLA
ncbi:aminotransferase class V-fold PLP-dependent enzyme [Pedobacter aquatilis]|uniref:aminotransferase class V-fold PLP-dependent enzyme n=1 Tax=Pedobacter aquatilis TaxID=351343 RepID=UPI0029317B81|nr:aminotransferase class V-fold PLP-dependent enzyme [Pedobacter aquatilis]